MVKQKIDKQTLEGLFKRTADLLRNKVDYSFILVIIYYKALSDYIQQELDEYGELIKRTELKPLVQYRWQVVEEMLHDSFNAVETFIQGIHTIENIKDDTGNQPFKGLLNKYRSFIDDIHENEGTIIDIIRMYSPYYFTDADHDIIGDAYEYFVHNFAIERGKEGEVYTPPEVVRLIVEIIQPQPGDSIYDPACGTGGMLIETFNYLRNHYGEAKATFSDYYGQEVRSDTYILANINLYMRGIPFDKMHLAQGDTLKNPKFVTEDGTLQRFDVVIANPPWNLKGYDWKKLSKSGEIKFVDRFTYGFPPKNSADWAWVQHMIASSSGEKRIGLVIDPGMLTRGNKEFLIRKRIIEDDLIEAVIMLPSGLFYHSQGLTGIIVILNKNKPSDRKGKVMFINASDYYEQHPSIKKLNKLTNIKEIAELIHNWKEKPYVSRIVSIKEICQDVREVMQKIEEKQEEIAKVDVQIKEIKNKIKNLKKQIKKRKKSKNVPNETRIKEEIEELEKKEKELSAKKEQMQSEIQSIKIENGCSLSVRRYVPIKIDEEDIDAVAVWKEIQEINNKIAEHEKFISKIVDVFFKGEDEHV